MGATRHSRSELDGFLDREFRQVWAVDRATGLPRYLPEGRAVALRAVARESWGCPVPGCDAPISTRGGSRRDHFFHVREAGHPSDGESDFHLAAKAMIAEWATRRVPRGVRVIEERTTRKDPATSRYRRADVMIEADGHPLIAFEIEYKTFPPAAWSVKHRDYTEHRPAPIRPVWLLGHSRLHRPPRRGQPDPTADAGDDIVRVPPLARALAADGLPVLAVNPVTRTVGTLVNHHLSSLAHIHEYAHLARIVLDPLDDCAVDPVRGLVTPTMLRVDEAERRRGDEDRRHAEEELALAAQRDRPSAYFDRIQADQADVWKRSDLRVDLQRRWGRIPRILAKPDGRRFDHGVWAHPAHWRCLIHEEFIASTPPGTRFTYPQIRAALAGHGISVHPDRRIAFRSVIRFMERLHHYGIVEIRTDDRGFKVFSVGHVTIEEAEAGRPRRPSA